MIRRLQPLAVAGNPWFGSAAEMVALRAERAKLLGYPSFAHFRLDDAMAKTPEAAPMAMPMTSDIAVAATPMRNDTRAP